MPTEELYSVFQEMDSLFLQVACSMDLLRAVSKMGEEVSDAFNPCIDLADFAYLVSHHYEGVSNSLKSFELKFSDAMRLLPDQKEAKA